MIFRQMMRSLKNAVFLLVQSVKGAKMDHHKLLQVLEIEMLTPK